MTSEHDVTQEFIDKYHSIWDGPSFCNYVNESNCQSFLGNADEEGFEMMIGFINIKNDGYVSQLPFSGSLLFNQSNI